MPVLSESAFPENVSDEPTDVLSTEPFPLVESNALARLLIARFVVVACARLVFPETVSCVVDACVALNCPTTVEEAWDMNPPWKVWRSVHELTAPSSVRLLARHVPATEKQPVDRLTPFWKVEVAEPPTLRLPTLRLPLKVDVLFVPATFKNPWMVDVPVVLPWMVVVAVLPTKN